MQNGRYFLPVITPAADATGATQNAIGYDRAYIMVTGTFDASLLVEEELAPDTWVAVVGATAITAALTVPLAVHDACRRIRVTTSSYVSGAPQVYLCGFGNRV